jgi:hypothetical protein
MLPGIVAHTCNPSYWEFMPWRITIPGHPRQKQFEKLHLSRKKETGLGGT